MCALYYFSNFVPCTYLHIQKIAINWLEVSEFEEQTEQEQPKREEEDEEGVMSPKPGKRGILRKSELLAPGACSRLSVDSWFWLRS